MSVKNNIELSLNRFLNRELRNLNETELTDILMFQKKFNVSRETLNFYIAYHLHK